MRLYCSECASLMDRSELSKSGYCIKCKSRTNPVCLPCLIEKGANGITTSEMMYKLAKDIKARTIRLLNDKIKCLELAKSDMELMGKDCSIKKEMSGKKLDELMKNEDLFKKEIRTLKSNIDELDTLIAINNDALRISTEKIAVLKHKLDKEERTNIGEVTIKSKM